MNRAIFKSFASQELCEKMLFGTKQRTGKTPNYELEKETFSLDGTDRDGLFVCIVFLSR